MTFENIKKINKSILLNLHSACVADINQACLCFSVHRSTAEAIVNLPIETLKLIASNANVLIYPPLIPAKSWEAFGSLKDDAISTITITQITSGIN